MKRHPVEWLSTPDEDEEMPSAGMEMVFRLADEWVAVDPASDQLILPVTIETKSTIDVDEPYSAILKQFGGEGLLNDMLLSDQDFEQGSRWVVYRDDTVLKSFPAPDDN